MQDTEGIDGFVVSQKKEWGEILTGWEQRNKYVVLDQKGNELFMAAEEGGSTFLRLFLKAARPFTIEVRTMDGQPAIRIERPFRWFFHEASIYNAQSQLLGTIKRQFSLLRRIYSVCDVAGHEAYQLFGPILHPWTFEIRRGGTTLGKITKKWSGLLKEGFTDADNFGVTFPNDWEVADKAVVLGAVFLIDFVHFENKGDN